MFVRGFVFIVPSVGELLTQKYILVALTHVTYMIVSTLFRYHVVSTWYSGFVMDGKMFDCIGMFIVLVTSDDPIRSWNTEESLKICCWTPSKRRITEMRSSVDSVIRLFEIFVYMNRFYFVFFIYVNLLQYMCSKFT